jgi:hypothetical protein
MKMPRNLRNLKHSLTPEQVAFHRICPGMRVHHAIEIYGLGRNKLYDLMKDGRVKFTKVDDSTILSTSSLEALVSPKKERRWVSTQRRFLSLKILLGGLVFGRHRSEKEIPIVNIPVLQPKLVKINPLIDPGTGATHVEVYDIGEYRQKHGALAAALKLREMRAEARRVWAWRQLTSLPRLRRGNHPPRIRIARARAIKAKAAPKRTARKANRSPCHGRKPDPGDGAARPNTQPVSLVERGDQ